MLVAVMNPCYCGYYGDSQRQCTCSPSMVNKYQKRISGPLLDRIDIFVEVPRVEYEKLTADAAGEESSAVRQRVEQASERQRHRFAGTSVQTNADMGPAEVWDHCKLDDAAQSLAKAAMDQLQLSARAYPPHPEAFSHHRGPRRRRQHRRLASGGGCPVSTSRERVGENAVPQSYRRLIPAPGIPERFAP